MNKNKNSGIQSTRAFFSKEKLQRLTKKLQRLTKCPVFFRNYSSDQITSTPAIHNVGYILVVISLSKIVYYFGKKWGLDCLSCQIISV